MTSNRRIKLLDVARDAGVSPATVSRAIAQPQLVNSATLARVKSSAARLGYVPGGAARALASGRSMTIGAVVPTLDSAIFARTLQSMQAALSLHGFQLLVASHDYNAAAEAEAIRILLTRGVDGLMLVGAERPAATWELLEVAGVAVVLTWCGDARANSVTVDNEKAGRLAAQHLVDLGHKRIGAVVGASQFNDRQKARLAGIRAALRAAALDLPDWLVSEQPLTLAGGRTGCSSMLGLEQPPTALIGGIDMLAIGCIEEVHSRGLTVPHALSVVGIDNIEMSAHVFPSLTSVHLPVTRIGEAAAGCLLDELAGRGAKSIQELPIELVPRKSSARNNSA
jgi:LacI family transcriptional regulator, galactose operon repressor